jgi:hypothetical protein
LIITITKSKKVKHKTAQKKAGQRNRCPACDLKKSAYFFFAAFFAGLAAFFAGLAAFFAAFFFVAIVKKFCYSILSTY